MWRGVAIKWEDGTKDNSLFLFLILDEDGVMDLSENLHSGGGPNCKIMPDSPERKVEQMFRP